MAQEKYNPEDIATALRNTKGMVFVAAQNIGCSAQTIYNYARRYPDIVQKAIDEERGKATDVAEMALLKAIQKEKPWAVCFYLKTQGRNRGYVERSEQIQLTEDQVDRLIERELERLAEAGEAEAIEAAPASEGEESSNPAG